MGKRAAQLNSRSGGGDLPTAGASPAAPAPRHEEAPPRWSRPDGAKEEPLPEGYDMKTTDEAKGLADLLRGAADLVADHPEIPTPYVTGISYTHSGESSVDLNWFIPIAVSDPVEQKRTAASILRAIGGKWDKDPNPDEKFNFTQTRGGLHLKVQVQREAVCERVVTGTETVELAAMPARPAEPARTVEREIVEWRCEPLLAEVSA